MCRIAHGAVHMSLGRQVEDIGAKGITGLHYFTLIALPLYYQPRSPARRNVFPIWYTNRPLQCACSVQTPSTKRGTSPQHAFLLIGLLTFPIHHQIAFSPNGWKNLPKRGYRENRLGIQTPPTCTNTPIPPNIVTTSLSPPHQSHLQGRTVRAQFVYNKTLSLPAHTSPILLPHQQPQPATPTPTLPPPSP